MNIKITLDIYVFDKIVVYYFGINIAIFITHF